MLDIRISRLSQKFIVKLPLKHINQIKTKLHELRRDPYPHDSKQLIGFDYYRADVGEYRIIYKTEENVLFIILVGKRNDDEVYKKLKRL